MSIALKKQELFKGCALWYGVNAATFSGAEIEGGWGISANHKADMEELKALAERLRMP